MSGGGPGRYAIPVFVGIALVVGVALTGEEGIVGGARIKSGDRLVIDGRMIRLHAITAPKVGEGCETRDGKWDCGRRALVALSRAIDRGRVSCEPVEGEKQGQLTAICQVKGRELNAQMVEEGWARADKSAPEKYRALEKAAKSARKGIWR